MQPQEIIAVPAYAFSLVGAELLSFLQLLFFLTLGYAVTRTLIWSRQQKQKAAPKTVDDMDSLQEGIQGQASSESEATPSSKQKSGTRNANANDRKKTKKTKEAVKIEEPCVEPVPLTAPTLVQKEQLPELCSQKPEVVEPPAATQEAPAVEVPHERPVSERVAKMMAKKMERKAKKAQEMKEEKLCEEEPVEKPDIVALVESKSDAEALSDDMAQTPSTPSMVPVQKDVQSLQVDMTPIPKETSDTLESTETDMQSESDDICVPSSTPDGISTPEQCLTPRGLTGEPLVWCGVPTLSPVPQIEGWMAVAVPAEFAPAGAPGPFDGVWQNGDDERITIDRDAIQFEAGMKWVMQMQSLTSLTVVVGGEEFNAQLDPASQTLTWSDGDVWTCVGQTEGQQQWAAAREAAGLPSFMLEGEQFFPMAMEIDPMTMEMMNPMAMEMVASVMLPNMVVPEEAKSWEMCWDWSKKGWCPRGADCEWYHPPQPPQQFASTCKPCASSAPFADFSDWM